jgi:hypothetical protein
MAQALIGRTVEGNWGAMHPLSHGVINGARVERAQRQVLIQWDDLSPEWVNIMSIKQPGETSVNGSPIGIFWEQV